MLKIGNKIVGPSYPSYFIAEIGSNHEGRLQRAKDLIYMAKEAGADCAKFQHYLPNTLATKDPDQWPSSLAHYTQNPYEVFKRYWTDWRWTPVLKEYCDSINIEFMSTPYDLEVIDHLDPYVNAFKIGSGDITYLELIQKVASKQKPVIISTGASDMIDVEMAVSLLMTNGIPTCVMQCTTNYEGGKDVRDVNLNVLTSYQDTFHTVVGLSDHNTSITIVTGAVAMGARVIERHFTDDRSRSGPDHPFAMDQMMFKKMVNEVRILERALGSHNKFITQSERETVVLQRRCLRAARDLNAGHVLSPQDLVSLRPAPMDSYPPYQIDRFIGQTLAVDMKKGEEFDALSIDRSADFQAALRRTEG